RRPPPVGCQILTPLCLRSVTCRSSLPNLILCLGFSSSDHIEVSAFSAAIEAHGRKIAEAIMACALQIF
ncbi:unnamed protein product, partial [Musa banksii]